VAQQQAVPLSPEWWVARLYKRLQSQASASAFFDDYYRGVHPLPWLAPQAREEFRRILQMTTSNYMGLVVDSMVERLHVEGFRSESGDADDDSWRIWQANNLDSDFGQALLEAGIGGCSYLLVAPNKDDEKTPHIWVEHASQATVEFRPGTNRRVRAAGLKVWDDDWTGQIHATLYLPDGIYKYRAERLKSGASPRNPQWVEREVPGEQPNGQRKNPLGVVPLVELPNNPRLLTGGVSELFDVTDVQDRINKTLADRLMTQDYGAFPQKWAKAWPDEDEDGNPNTIDVGRNRMVTTDVKETEFGQWDSAPLDPYSAAKREDVKDIASRTRTPAQYLLGEMSNVNGETLKASESGLVSKVRQRMRPFGEGAETAMNIARRIAGLPESPRLETIWRNPEFRTEGELTDAVVKRLQSGISSLRQAREDVGYSATQIERLEEDDSKVASNDPIIAASAKLLNGGAGASAGGQ
jgi:hypothetical protein